MVKIIKGGFVIHSVVRGNFPEGLTFKPRPRQRGVSSEGSRVGCEKAGKVRQSWYKDSIGRAPEIRVWCVQGI